MVADPAFHLLDQLPHGLPHFPHQLVAGNSFLLVEMKHLLLKNIVGELGFDLPDAILRQIRLIRFCRPCHHMHMGMVAFIMEGSVPTKVLGRDVHSGGNIVAVGAEEIPPRPGIVVAQPLRISDINAVQELCLTTNGSLLPNMAASLRDAGVSRLNLSLDTLVPERFSAITRRGQLSDVMNGIRAAEDAGFTNLKINSVLIGGFNDDEVGDLIALTVDHPWEIRFIELMPMGPCADWDENCFLSNETILERFPFLTPIESQGVARRYRFPGAKGTIGLISPLSHEFCSQCRRIRVTADGKLKGCLHSREEISLKGLHGQQLETAIRWGIRQKPQCHHLTERPSDTLRTMNQIGG